MKAKLSIEELITKYLLGNITSPEKEQLDEWIKSSTKHKEFFNRLRNNVSFRERYTRYAQINSHHAWRLFQKKYLFTSALSIPNLLKYAAILLIPTLLGIVGWYLSPSAETIQPSYTFVAGDAITPGISKATLIIDTNSSKSLNPASSAPVQISQSTTALIQNGTLIYPTAGTTANDQEEEQQKPAEAIENNTLTTDQGNEFRVTFEDGTTVHLNYNTEIRYPVKFSKNKRIVYLKGEAYFKVAKDARPFYVITNEGTIKQYGTEFNVNTFTPNRTEVSLVKGSISITPQKGTEERMLQPGQLAHADLNSANIDIYNVDLTPYIAWNEGRLIFENRTLASIAEILEHWYNVHISFGSTELEQLHFTGNMDRYGTISPILKAIARTTNLHIQINGREILITSN